MVPISSLPRHDMNASSNAQDILEKRRRQIDRAKAANLSKQLQMRLQYARLKVEHGWQKQTLNEVENLYFHYYRGMALSGDSKRISKPTKDQSRRIVNINVHADAETDEWSPTKDLLGSNLTQVPMGIGPSTTNPSPKSPPLAPQIGTDVPNVDNPDPVSPILVPFTELIRESSQSLTGFSSAITQVQPQKPISHSPGSSPTSTPPNLPLMSCPDHSIHPNMLTSPTEIPASSTTQVQKHAEINSHTQTKILLSPPSLPSPSASPTSALTARLEEKLTSTRTPTKLPIPRLPALSYPYAVTTSSGKARKAIATSNTSQSFISSLPASSITAPTFSTYKSPYSSTSAAPQNMSPLAGNSINGTPSLPLTYDSFWSSHTSSSSLPLSYRTSLNVNLSSSPSRHTAPTISSPIPSSSNPAPSTSTSFSSTLLSVSTPANPSPSPSRPFLHSANPSNPSLSHSSIIASLLHSQGLPIFQQSRHSPTPLGATDQNTQVG